jgi:hypothetical protein
MAHTSQQAKEWGRHVVPPRQDIGAALAALSQEDLLRLRALARLAPDRLLPEAWLGPTCCTRRYCAR